MKDINEYNIYTVDINLTISDLIMQIYDETDVNHNDELELQLDMIEKSAVIDNIFINAIQDVYVGNNDLIDVKETLYKNNDFSITLNIKNFKYTFRYKTLVDAISQEIINRALDKQKLQYYRNIIFPKNQDINYIFLSIFLQKKIEDIDVFHIKISKELNNIYEIEQLLKNTILNPYIKETFYGLLKSMKNMEQNIVRYKRMINAHIFYQLDYQDGQSFLDDTAQDYIFKDDYDLRSNDISNRTAIQKSFNDINTLNNYNSIIMKILLLKYLDNKPLNISTENNPKSFYITEDEALYKIIFDMVDTLYIQEKVIIGFSKEKINIIIEMIEAASILKKRKMYTFPKKKGALSLQYE